MVNIGFLQKVLYAHLGGWRASAAQRGEATGGGGDRSWGIEMGSFTPECLTELSQASNFVLERTLLISRLGLGE